MGTIDGISKMRLYVRDAAIAFGLIFLFIGLCDIDLAHKSVTFRPSPAWPQAIAGAALFVFTWFIPIRKRDLPQFGEQDVPAVGQSAEAKRDTLRGLGASDAEITETDNLDGHCATIFLLRHYDYAYRWDTDYAYALYWWFATEKGLTPSRSDFDMQEEAWRELNRTKVSTLLTMGLLEPIGNEFKISEKGKALLSNDAFKGRNMRAFQPQLQIKIPYRPV
jgi:hypothetical protein